MNIYVIYRYYIDGYAHMIFSTVVYAGEDLETAKKIYIELNKYAQKTEGYELMKFKLNDTYIVDTIIEEYKRNHKKRKKTKKTEVKPAKGINYGQELLEFLKGRLKDAKIDGIGKSV